MLKVTSEAAEQLKVVLNQQEKDEVYIRIFVNGMG
jgi:Fe-S cluster assembly iron-binding protein IscA